MAEEDALVAPIDLSSSTEFDAKKIPLDAFTSKETDERQARFKDVMKLMLWTDKETAPVMAAKLVAQKVADNKLLHENMTPAVNKILDDLQTKIGVKAGLPAELFQTDDPSTQIKDTVVEGHSIDEAAKYLAHHNVFVKGGQEETFSNEKEASAYSNDAGTADTSSPNLDLGIGQYFDEARAEAMKLAIQSRAKALSAIDSIELAYKSHIENANNLQATVAPSDLTQAKAVLDSSDKKSIAASVNTLTVDAIGQPAPIEKSLSAASPAVAADTTDNSFWVYGAIFSATAFFLTALWYKKKKKHG